MQKTKLILSLQTSKSIASLSGKYSPRVNYTPLKGGATAATTVTSASNLSYSSLNSCSAATRMVQTPRLMFSTTTQ